MTEGHNSMTANRSPRFAPSDLVPNTTTAAAVDSKLFFWVGLMLTAPLQQVTVGGVAFSKGTETLLPPDPGDTKRRRAPVHGSIVKLDKRGFERLADRVSRTVVRVQEVGRKNEPGTGENTGQPHERALKATPIQIPTDEEVRIAQEKGRVPRLYTPHAGDVPIANLLYVEACANQQPGVMQGKIGSTMPPPLSETGLVWPGAEPEEPELEPATAAEDEDDPLS